MRNMVSALVILTATALAPAQSPEWAVKMFTSPQGGSAVHDFGSVPRGAQLYHRFPITNIWAFPIEVLSVRTSCGCVSTRLSSQVIQPRESGYLDVTMDARRFTGHKTVSIYVSIVARSDGQEYSSTATLQVSAHSRADVVFNPGQVNFGIVAAGQTPSQVIDVEYAGALDWRVTEVHLNGAPLTTEAGELYRRPGQVGYRIRVALKPDAAPGAHKWELVLKTTDPASPLVPVLVEATVRASLAVVPNPLKLNGLKVGEAVTQRVVVRGSKPFKITSVEGLGDGIQADLPANAAAVQILTVKCQPTQAGELRRQLLIKTDLTAESPAAVLVEGTVAP